MKTSKLVGICLLAAALCAPVGVAADTLTIIIQDIREASGVVQVQVLSGQAQFEGDGSTAQFRESAVQGSLTITAEDLPAGEYAIRVMHDVNGNDELDANLVGMPVEPWGFSNNATGKFGPPEWSDARFALAGDATHVIKLIH